MFTFCSCLLLSSCSYLTRLRSFSLCPIFAFNVLSLFFEEHLCVSSRIGKILHPFHTPIFWWSELLSQNAKRDSGRPPIFGQSLGIP